MHFVLCLLFFVFLLAAFTSSLPQGQPLIDSTNDLAEAYTDTLPFESTNNDNTADGSAAADGAIAENTIDDSLIAVNAAPPLADDQSITTDQDLSPNVKIAEAHCPGDKFELPDWAHNIVRPQKPRKLQEVCTPRNKPATDSSLKDFKCPKGKKPFCCAVVGERIWETDGFDPHVIIREFCISCKNLCDFFLSITDCSHVLVTSFAACNLMPPLGRIFPSLAGEFDCCERTEKVCCSDFIAR